MLLTLAGAGLLLWLPSCSTQPPTVQNLRCEYVRQPLGMNVEKPRLSWELSARRNGVRQAAYRILVASSWENLNRQIGDLWDTGKIRSGQTTQIIYAGKKLSSRQRAYWKVRVWDPSGKPCAWSHTAWWETGLAPDDWQARWIAKKMGKITHPKAHNPAFYFRKEFWLSDAPQNARAYICGLGYYELYINGKKVDNHVLSPNQTNYDRRSARGFPEKEVGHMATRVLYEIHDITPYLKPGQNALAVCLGNGWYFQNDKEETRSLSYDTPRVIAQFEVNTEDGKKIVVVTDSTWKTTTGPILHNGVYTGEIYDARLEMPGWDRPGFDDWNWEAAVEVRAPTGKLLGQISPPDRVVRTLRPVSVKKISKNTYRFDLGQILSGWAQLHVSGPQGARLNLRFVEDSKADYGQRDAYILRGGGPETWEPRFTWHGFRYVEVEHAPFPLTLENLSGRVVNTDVKEAGLFESSNRLFNQILKNYKRTQLGNLHGGVPSDCPHRERRGYTGDGQISAPAALYNFDMAALYTKWVADIADAQNHKTGYVPNTAPYESGGGGTPWGSAIVLIPWDLYQFYGDVRVLKTYYLPMKQWVDYLTRHRDAAGLIAEENLGEWVPPDSTAVPPALVSTAYYFHDLELLSKIAHILGNEKDAQDLKILARSTQNAFHKSYFHPKENSYSIGRQGANVFALGFGLVTDSLQAAVFHTLAQHIERDTKGHFDTGMMGTPLLLEVLTRFGRADLAYTLMNQRDFPSFGYEIENGATTLWETWPGDASHSHPMFGSVCAWFYEGLAGIRPDEAKPGFQHVIFRPHPLNGLNFVRASYHSIHGKIESRWILEKGTFTLQVVVPPNVTASVFVPVQTDQKVAVRGKPASLVAVQNHLAHFEIGSGRYTFVSKDVGSLLPMPLFPAPRIVPRDTTAFFPHPVDVKIQSDVPGAEIRFTTDGTEPTANSPLYTGPFNVLRRSEIRARVFKTGYRPGFVSRSRIDLADSVKNGLTYTYFEGDWKRLPDFERFKPLGSGHVYQISLKTIHPEAEKFGLIFSGQIAIARPGTYTFSLISNDGSALFIDGKRVMANDGLHGATEKSGQIRLSAGRHRIRATYFQAGGGMKLEAFYAGPGVPRQKIPASVLFVE